MDDPTIPNDPDPSTRDALRATEDLRARLEALERSYRRFRRGTVGAVVVAVVALAAGCEGPVGPEGPPFEPDDVPADAVEAPPGVVTFPAHRIATTIDPMYSAEGLQVEGLDAGIALFTTARPPTLRNEGYVVYKGFSPSGSIEKMASVSALWFDPATGTGVLRLNAVAARNLDDAAIRIFGGRGVAVFGPDDVTAPGAGVMRVHGKLVVDEIEVRNAGR